MKEGGRILKSVAIDTGGTMTDAVIMDTEGEFTVGKAYPLFRYRSIPHKSYKNPSKSPFRKGGLRGFDIPEETSKIINSFVVTYR